MELVVSELACDAAKETWRLHSLTDLHIDDSDHADAELRARIAVIEADPKALWIGGGDYASLIQTSDPRYQSSPGDEVHYLPDLYLERCVDRLAPIRDKCLALGSGNHEWTIAKKYHRGVVSELAMRLGIPEKYLGARGWYVMKFSLGTRHLTLKGYQYHGWSSGRSKGRKALQADRDVASWRADILTLGHDHQPYADVVYSQECYDSKRGYRLRNRPVAIINGGAWLYGQKPPATEAEKRDRAASEWPSDSWQEGKNFRPQPPVSPILEIHLDFGGTKKVDGEGRPSGYTFETRTVAATFDL